MRYSILTYNFNNYEVLHEVENPQDDVEYIYVTDNPDLISKTWKIIVDDSLKDLSTFDKCYAVRFNPFKYCSTDICIRIDGSIIVKSSPDMLIDKFNREEYDLALCPHPYRHNFVAEYNAWVSMRNYPIAQATKCLYYMKRRGYDFRIKSMIQENIVIQRRNKLNNDIDRMTYALLKYLGSENEIERIDQIITSYILNTHFRNMKIMPLSELIVHSDMFQWCMHGTDISIEDYNKIDRNAQQYNKSYLFDKEVNLITPEILQIENEQLAMPEILRSANDYFKNCNTKYIFFPSDVHTKDVDEANAVKTWCVTNRRKNTIDISDYKEQYEYYTHYLANEHHFTTKTQYDFIIPKMDELLDFGYNKDDFNLIPYSEDNFDLSYLYPKNDKNFTIKNYSSEYTGNFNELMGLNNRNGLSKYHSLFRFPHESCIIINNIENNGRTLLISGDSQNIPELPILAYYFKKIIYLDNRKEHSGIDYNDENITDILFSFFEKFSLTKQLVDNFK